MVEALGERWIEKCRAMPVMIRVLHRCDTRAGEDIGEQLLELLELRCHLLEQHIVMFVLCRREFRSAPRRTPCEEEIRARGQNDEAEANQPPPVARETLISTAARPDVRRAFGLLSVAQQLGAIVGITEPLHLKAQLVVQTGKQKRELILEGVKMLGRSGAQVRRLDEEPFETCAAFAEPMEDDDVAEE